MKIRLLALMLAAVLTTSGCTLSRQPEHQAYSISLAVDMTPDGQITASVQVPTIGAQASSSSQDQESASSQSKYFVYAATGPTFPEAIDLLQVTVPRTLKLTQLKSVVFGESLARSEHMGTIIDQLIMSYYVYGAATVIMCLGNAKEFLEKQQPTIGTRLSTSLTARLEHFALSGYVVLTSLYGLFASNHSIYSDPVIAVAANASPEMAEYNHLPPDSMGEMIAGQMPRASSSENEYMGAALMKRGKVVQVLTGQQCQWLEVLCSNVITANYSFRGTAMQLHVAGAPDFEIELFPDRVEVAVGLRFVCVPLVEAPDTDALSKQLESEFRALISLCQENGVEPFNLSELVAHRFLTIDDFVDYDFAEKFCAADVRVSVEAELYTA